MGVWNYELFVWKKQILVWDGRAALHLETLVQTRPEPHHRARSLTYIIAAVIYTDQNLHKWIVRFGIPRTSRSPGRTWWRAHGRSPLVSRRSPSLTPLLVLRYKIEKNISRIDLIQFFQNTRCVRWAGARLPSLFLPPPGTAPRHLYLIRRAAWKPSSWMQTCPRELGEFAAVIRDESAEVTLDFRVFFDPAGRTAV